MPLTMYNKVLSPSSNLWVKCQNAYFFMLHLLICSLNGPERTLLPFWPITLTFTLPNVSLEALLQLQNQLCTANSISSGFMESENGKSLNHAMLILLARSRNRPPCCCWALNNLNSSPTFLIGVPCHVLIKTGGFTKRLMSRMPWHTTPTLALALYQ